MNKILKLLCLGISLITLVNCAGPGGEGGVTKQGGGATIGALAGGLVGSQFGKGSGKFLTVGLGALAGGLAGSAIGRQLDERDRALAAKSSQQALELSPVGQAVEWSNPDSGHYGSITPTKTFKSNEGRYCREYQHNVVVGGKAQKAYGTACRQPDGQWEIVKQ